MFFKRSRSSSSPTSSTATARPSRSRPEPPAPEASSDTSAPIESDDRRSLAALIRDDGARPAAPTPAQRYSDAARILAREGGARVPHAPASPGPRVTVTSDGRGERSPDLTIRFASAPARSSDPIFELHAPAAKSVHVAGDFSDWRALPLSPVDEAPGLWRLTQPLPRGEYRYKFKVDGRWINDPLNPLRKPNPFGDSDSVLRVSIGP